jgi:methylmalonyl-CoA/ethylmalonyl-CoA epimerase
METNAPGKYKKLHHVGLVVKDIEKAMAYFESIGIGPFEAGGKRKIAVDFVGELNGKPAKWKTTISNANLGGVELELLEPTEGAQALKESLDATGEGLHHIGFLVDDYDATLAKCKKDGLKIWTLSKPVGRPGFLYTKPASPGKLAIEFRTP